MTTKTLLMFVAASSIALPTVVLAADITAANVSVYGKAHLSLDNLSDGDHSGRFLSSNSSRFGVKGSSELGTTGLTGLFQFETGVALDNGGGNLFSGGRDSFVGVKSGFGTLRGGRLSEGGSNAWVYDANLFADQVGDAGNFTGSIGVGGRGNNALNYATPEFGGFSANVTYVPNESTATTAEDSMGATLRFGGGGLALGGHYYRFGDSTTAPDRKAAAVSAGYNIGMGMVNAMYVKHKNEGNVGGADRNIATVGAGVKLGSGLLKAQYSLANDVSGTSNTGARMWAVGYDHAIAKGTTVYIAYARVNNDSAANFTSNDYGHGDSPTVAAGKNPSGVSLGLVYDFSLGGK